MVTLGHVLLLFWGNLPTILDLIAEFYPVIIYPVEYLALLAFGIVFIVTSAKLIKSHEGKSDRKFTAIIVTFVLIIIIIPIDIYLTVLLGFGLPEDLWVFVFFSFDFLYALIFVIVILMSYFILPNNKNSKKRTKIIIGITIGSVILWGIGIIVSYLLVFLKYSENHTVMIILSLIVIAAQSIYAILGIITFYALRKELKRSSF